MGWGDSLLNKVVGLQVWGPEFRFQDPHKSQAGAGWLLVILVHGRQRRGILEGGLVRLAKSGSSVFSQRTYLSKEGVKDHQHHQLWASKGMCTHVCVCTPSQTCKHAYTHAHIPKHKKEWHVAFAVTLWTLVELNTIYLSILHLMWEIRNYIYYMGTTKTSILRASIFADKQLRNLEKHLSFRISTSSFKNKTCRELLWGRQESSLQTQSCACRLARFLAAWWTLWPQFSGIWDWPSLPLLLFLLLSIVYTPAA